MSNTKKTLKRIASSEEYQALVTAIDQTDYESIFSSYVQISRLLEEAGSEIEKTIENLPRRNKDDERRRFQSAFCPSGTGWMRS